MLDGLRNEQGIYVITQISTGRKYVGKSKNVKKRIKQHLSRSSQEIHKALLSSPIEDFSLSVMYCPELDPHELNDLEYETIKLENSMLPLGFNRICRGSVRVISNETKEKLSKALKGRSFSTDHKKKLSDAWKARESFSEETKNKMSFSRLGKVCSEEVRLNMSRASKNVIRKSKSFIFKDASGKSFEGSISDFALAFGFNRNSTNTNFSKRGKHKGWIRQIAG